MSTATRTATKVAKKERRGKTQAADILRALQAVRPGLSPREIVRQSSCFVFTGGEVVTFNDETCCRAPSPLGVSVEGAVSAKPLLGALKRLGKGDVEIVAQRGALTLKAGAGRTTLDLQGDIEPEFRFVEAPKKWDKLPAEFTEALRAVLPCASQDQSHFEMTCIHLHPEWIEACDNFQLCRWPMETGLRAPILVRRSSLRHVASLGMTEWGVTENWVHFRNDERLTLSCRRYQKPYKDFTKHLNVKGEPIMLPKQLADAAGMAGGFASQYGRHEWFLGELRPGELYLTGTGQTGSYSEVLSVGYEGPSLQFRIAPRVLASLARMRGECSIAPGQLNVKSEKYTYVACLIDPDLEPQK